MLDMISLRSRLQRAGFAILASAALAAACKPAENSLQYYTTSKTYETVDVQMPPVNNEVRNVILMIGDGMGLEQVSCAWVVNHSKLNIPTMTRNTSWTRPACMAASSRMSWPRCT